MLRRRKVIPTDQRTKEQLRRLHWQRSPKGKWNAAKYQCARRKDGRPFELTLDEFRMLMYSPCSYCGRKSTIEEPNSVDRVDNDKGYTVANTKSACYTCDHWKCTLTTEQFIQHARTIVKYNDEKMVIDSN